VGVRPKLPKSGDTDLPLHPLELRLCREQRITPIFWIRTLAPSPDPPGYSSDVDGSQNGTTSSYSYTYLLTYHAKSAG